MGGKGGGDGGYTPAQAGWTVDPATGGWIFPDGSRSIPSTDENAATMVPAPAAPTAAAAPGPSLGGATDTADTAAPSGGDSSATTQDSSTGGTLAASVLKAPSYWNTSVQPQTPKKSTGSAVVTQT